MISDIQRLETIPSKDVEIKTGFWGERQATNRDRTIPAIYHQMKITGRLDAWRSNWQPGQPKPHIFWDSMRQVDRSRWLQPRQPSQSRTRAAGR